ncbi:MAG: hypothetical protein HY519_01410 [Candidatus Aenigmarchaeota archaeon]|nr:hypothetical protein [Candidatus Aenigmarchaeota archaeon]
MQRKHVFQAVKRYNGNNPASAAWLLSMKNDAITIELRPGCNCKYGVLGHAYEFRAELENAALQPVSIERIRKLENSYLVRLAAVEREVLRH